MLWRGIVLHEKKIVRPVNSIIFVADPNGGDAPKPVRDAQILSTPSCISVGCYPEQDGSTEVVLGDADEVDPRFKPAFDGELQTPNRAVTVSTADRRMILEMGVPRTLTPVRIWVNHPRWPDKVIIGLA